MAFARGGVARLAYVRDDDIGTLSRQPAGNRLAKALPAPGAGDDGCFACKPYEAVLRGEAEFIGIDEYKSDVYVLNRQDNKEEVEGSILL